MHQFQHMKTITILWTFWYLPDEEELRLRVFQDEAPNGTTRSKHTARGQPAPPIPQEDLSPQTPTQTQTQPKAQTRARPPPPPEDNEEYPPSLPRPRNKQHHKRNEEPYRPMEWDACMLTERVTWGLNGMIFISHTVMVRASLKK